MLEQVQTGGRASLRRAAEKTMSLVLKNIHEGADIEEIAYEMERQYPFIVSDGPARRIYTKAVDGFVRKHLDPEQARRVITRLRMARWSWEACGGAAGTWGSITIRKVAPRAGGPARPESE